MKSNNRGTAKQQILAADGLYHVQKLILNEKIEELKKAMNRLDAKQKNDKANYGYLGSVQFVCKSIDNILEGFEYLK